MSTLHEQITAAVEKRLAVAQAATPGPWYWDQTKNPEWGDQAPWLKSSTAKEQYEHAGQTHEYDTTVVGAWGHDAWGISVADADAAFIADNDPARIIRDCRRDLKVLERHNREPAFLSAWVCRRCRPILRGPCVELRDLAEAYEIEATA